MLFRQIIQLGVCGSKTVCPDVVGDLLLGIISNPLCNCVRDNIMIIFFILSVISCFIVVIIACDRVLVGVVYGLESSGDVVIVRGRFSGAVG